MSTLRIALLTGIWGLILAFCPVGPAAAQDTRPFSRAELLAYLSRIPGSQDYSVPYAERQRAHQRLARLIEERGVSFKHDLGKFDQELYNAGADTEVMIAISSNYRPAGAASPRPVMTPTSYVGTWQMGIAGSSPRHDRRGSYTVRTYTDVGARGGFLQINPNGTYVWKWAPSDPPSKYYRGRWRPATEEEMRTDAGQGVVLLRGYDGADWIVTQWERGDASRARVASLNQRYLYYIASRSAR